MGGMRNVTPGTMPLNMGGAGGTMGGGMTSNMMSLGGGAGGMMQQHQAQRGNFSMEPDCIVLRNVRRHLLLFTAALLAYIPIYILDKGRLFSLALAKVWPVFVLKIACGSLQWAQISVRWGLRHNLAVIIVHRKHYSIIIMFA